MAVEHTYFRYKYYSTLIRLDVYMAQTILDMDILISRFATNPINGVPYRLLNHAACSTDS
jgi:hypothetical protein